ncbi:hypothetical protein [Nocardia beijingensis]|uniref:hypothetical protein n=1 Tax=Nocardia beijingensis TaxID=95162 RepID=UPI0033C115A5
MGGYEIRSAAVGACGGRAVQGIEASIGVAIDAVGRTELSASRALGRCCRVSGRSTDARPADLGEVSCLVSRDEQY